MGRLQRTLLQPGLLSCGLVLVLLGLALLRNRSVATSSSAAARLVQRTRRRSLASWGLLLALMALLTAPVSVGAADSSPWPTDYPIPAGHFFTQTGSGQGGFGVRDLAGVEFWSEYQRHGGPQALGYPISRPYWGPGGFLYQAFQRGILQWRPEQHQALPANTLELMEPHNSWLLVVRSIPLPRQPRPASFEQEAAERLSWLTNEAIREAFLTNPVTGETWDANAAANLHGLPQSEPQRFGPFLVQRFQRIPLQLWLEAVPGMPAPGSVVGVLSGELAKERGVIPDDATVPEPLVPPVNAP